MILVLFLGLFNERKTVKTSFKPYYTTGEVALTCGFKSARIVAKMFDNNEIAGELFHGLYGRHTTRRIPLKALIEFMQKRKIPLNRLTTDLDVLIRRTSELKKILERARKHGVFSGFNGLAERLMDVVANLDPLHNLNGVSEDKRRVCILRKLIEVMESHISVRGQIATTSRR